MVGLGCGVEEGDTVSRGCLHGACSGLSPSRSFSYRLWLLWIHGWASGLFFSDGLWALMDGMGFGWTASPISLFFFKLLSFPLSPPLVVFYKRLSVCLSLRNLMSCLVFFGYFRFCCCFFVKVVSACMCVCVCCMAWHCIALRGMTFLGKHGGGE